MSFLPSNPLVNRVCRHRRKPSVWVAVAPAQCRFALVSQVVALCARPRAVRGPGRIERFYGTIANAPRKSAPICGGMNLRHFHLESHRTVLL
jgi:hypothetical protein